MKADLIARLAAAAPVAALCGDNIAWHERQRRKPWPALVLTQVGTDRDYSHDGASGVRVTRVQMDCMGDDAGAVEALTLAVLAAIEPAGNVGATAFGQSFLDTERTFPPEDLEGGIKVHRTMLDLSIWHSPII